MNSIKQFLHLHQNGIKKALLFFPICVFGFIELFFENRFYFFFIIPFFFVILLLERRRYFFLIIITSLVFLIFNTITIDNLVIIKKVNLSFFQHPKQVLKNFFSPKSGLEGYPAEVKSMVSLLDTYNISSFQLSDKYNGDIEIQQRIVGAAWPIQMENTSPFIFIGADEIQNYQFCEIIEIKEDVALADCH